MKPRQLIRIKPDENDKFLLLSKMFCQRLGAPNSFLQQAGRHLELILLNINVRLVQFLKYPESSPLRLQLLKKNIHFSELQTFRQEVRDNLKTNFYNDNKMRAIAVEIMQHLENIEQMLK